MAVKAYFVYPEFAKKMDDGNRLTRALGKARHYFFHKYWKSGFDTHPKQKLALARLDTFMAENRWEFTELSLKYGENMKYALSLADEISKIPNYTVLMGTQRLASEMKNTAALRGLSCATYLEQAGEIRMSGEYRDLLVSLIQMTGAEKGDVLVVGTKGKGVLFMLENERGRAQDALGLELIAHCVEALGGSLSRMQGEGTDTFEMVLL